MRTFRPVGWQPHAMSSCGICKKPMRHSRIVGHMKHGHTEAQRAAYAKKVQVLMDKAWASLKRGELGC